MAAIDYKRVQELLDEGNKPIEIARIMGVTRGAISKVIKKLNLAVTSIALEAATDYVARKNKAADELMALTAKAKAELEFMEKEVPPKATKAYRAWQDQKLKFCVEIRKLISTMGDIAYKLYQSQEVEEKLRIIDEEIGRESMDCQRRIRDRLDRRESIRFPHFSD